MFQRFTQLVKPNFESGETAAQVSQGLKAQGESDETVGFRALLKKWDQASQMRSWISKVKLKLGEKIDKEETEKFIEEYNKANPSQEPLTGQLSED